MDSKDKDFLFQHSNWTEAEIEELNSIAQYITGEDLDVKEKMKMLWTDFTINSKKGKKQKDWQEVGSDLIIEQWATEISEDLNWLTQNFQQGFFGHTEEDFEHALELVERADEILGKMIY